MMARLIAVTATLAALAGRLQATDSYKAPELEKSEFWSYLVGVAALAALCVVAFKNSKRSNMG